MNRMLPALLLCLALAAEAKPPRRAVEGNVVTSAHDPAVRIELPRPARYVGVERWDPLWRRRSRAPRVGGGR